MSWVRTAGRSGVLFAVFFWLIALAIGVIVLSRASIAEFSANVSFDSQPATTLTGEASDSDSPEPDFGVFEP